MVTGRLKSVAWMNKWKKYFKAHSKYKRMEIIRKIPVALIPNCSVSRRRKGAIGKDSNYGVEKYLADPEEDPSLQTERAQGKKAETCRQ